MGVKLSNMAAAVERLAKEALALSNQERAELARKLLVRLEGPPDEDVNEAWMVRLQSGLTGFAKERRRVGQRNKCLGIFERVTSEASCNRGRGGT